MKNPIRFLVIDGYTQEARNELVAGGATMAASLYVEMLTACCPTEAVCDVIFPSDPGATLPEGVALTDFDAIAWTGCSLSIDDNEYPGIRSQLDLAEAAFAAGIPSFGTCWGIQIAIVAAGGRVQVHPGGREMGVARKIQLTPEGRGHPLYAGKTTVFDGFISHLDEVTHLPPGAVILAGNAFTRVQAACITHRKGTFWG
ncbi:MAG: type 1 glutamine amidotransferase, partial [Myxococcota bacterium]